MATHGYNLESIPEGEPFTIMPSSYFQPVTAPRMNEGSLPRSMSSVSNENRKSAWDTLRKRVKK